MTLGRNFAPTVGSVLMNDGQIMAVLIMEVLPTRVGPNENETDDQDVREKQKAKSFFRYSE
jgi:hypothetical protein